MVGVSDLGGLIGKPPEHNLNVFEWAIFLMVWVLWSAALIQLSGADNNIWMACLCLFALGASWYIANALAAVRIRRASYQRIATARKQLDAQIEFFHDKHLGDPKIWHHLEGVRRAYVSGAITDDQLCEVVDAATQYVFLMRPELGV